MMTVRLLAFAFTLVLSSYAFGQDYAVSIVGTQQFIDGMTAADVAHDGGIHGGGFSQGLRTDPTNQTPVCDSKLNIANLLNARTHGAKLVFFEPCHSGIQEQSALKDLTDSGVKVVLLSPVTPTDTNTATPQGNTDPFKNLLASYASNSQANTLRQVQDYGLGYTVGMALKSYQLQQNDLTTFPQLLRQGNYAAVTSQLGNDGLLTLDGWSAAPDCNPCPKTGTCPQGLVPQIQQCCGKSGACPQ